MRIRHNISAMYTYRMGIKNRAMLAKRLEKLSSGLRINRAADDAAGLALSEKMRAQLRGLETAGKNALDAISLLQTAEGALDETHNMLNRMVELAEQAANGVYDDTTDRAALEQEFEDLCSEIDRITQGTNFNGVSLLKRSGGAAAASTPAPWRRRRSRGKARPRWRAAHRPSIRAARPPQPCAPQRPWRR